MEENIEFVDGIYVFRRKRGTYTAIGEAKLRIQQTMQSTHPLFQLYIDLEKAYDNLDRKVAMRILLTCGTGEILGDTFGKFGRNNSFY